MLTKILFMILFLKFFDMELRVYKSLNDWSARNSVLAVRIDVVDGLLFPYDSTVRAFKAIYGDSCVIDFVIL